MPFSSLIDPLNPSNSSGIQSPFHYAHSLKFRAVAFGTMCPHAGYFSISGEAGLTKSPVLSSSLRLTEFGLENRVLLSTNT